MAINDDDTAPEFKRRQRRAVCVHVSVLRMCALALGAPINSNPVSVKELLGQIQLAEYWTSIV